MLCHQRRGCCASTRLLIALAMVAGALPRATALDQGFQSHSTMAPRVAPQNLDLDAAIASLVRRRVIADVRQPPSQPQPQPQQSQSQQSQASEKSSPAPSLALRPNAGRQSPGPGWRAAGQAASQPEVNSANVAGAPVFPTLPSAPVAPATPNSATLDSSADAVTPTEEEADDDAPDDGAHDDDASDDDRMAPIDELSETPAPSDDAPGDPLEPEYTGPAVAPLEAERGQSSARPLPGAATLGDRAAIPLGEPDRLARPSKDATPPASPEDYQESDAVARPRKLRPLSRNQIMLRDKIRSVLKYYYARPLNTGDRSPWEVMHSMLAFEVHSRVLQGGPQGDPITAVGWLCFNQPCKNRTLMYLNEDGDMRVKVGPALQGHHGQLLALLAQARVRSDYPMRVDGEQFTVADLIEMEQATCYPRTELTFKLIGLQRYLDIEATWVNDQGMQWDFPTLLREEMQQPVKTAACGGTHRLSGLALAVKKRRNSGLPVDGEYAQAAKFVANYQNYAYRLQNSDGSFSTDWFKGSGAEPDVDRRLKTTGHILEWLIYSTPEEQLTNYRMVRAVNYLTNIMHANRTRDWEAGPLGHAVHALVLYDRLLFAPHDAEPAAGPVAQQPRRTKR